MTRLAGMALSGGDPFLREERTQNWQTIMSEHEGKGLYYLLPGMGKANRRRRRKVLKWAIIFGVIFSVLFGLLLYFINTSQWRR